MKHLYKNYYRFTKPPKALLQAKLDNIAIVPASMLVFEQTIHHIRNTMPQGAVFLCYAAENTRQRKLLERVGETFRQQGHTVSSMSLEQAVQM